MQVEKYEVKYISLGAMSEQEHRSLDPSEMAEDGTLVIEDFPGAADKAMRLEARILYSDGVFSPWISSKEPVSNHAPPLIMKNQPESQFELIGQQAFHVAAVARPMTGIFQQPPKSKSLSTHIRGFQGSSS